MCIIILEWKRETFALCFVFVQIAQAVCHISTAFELHYVKKTSQTKELNPVYVPVVYRT